MADEQDLRPARDTHTPSSLSDLPPQALNLASLADRLLAQAVDGLVALGIFFSLGMALAGRFGGLTAEGFNLTGALALILIGILIAVMLGNFIIAEGFFGMTLGKVVAEIQVAGRDGGRIGMRASVIRNLMRLIDGIGIYLVGAFSVILTTRRVRLGDLAAGTIVVRRDQGRVMRAGVLIIALLLAAGGVCGEDFSYAKLLPRPRAELPHPSLSQCPTTNRSILRRYFLPRLRLCMSPSACRKRLQDRG